MKLVLIISYFRNVGTFRKVIYWLNFIKNYLVVANNELTDNKINAANKLIPLNFKLTLNNFWFNNKIGSA